MGPLGAVASWITSYYYQSSFSNSGDLSPINTAFLLNTFVMTMPSTATHFDISATAYFTNGSTTASNIGFFWIEIWDSANTARIYNPAQRPATTIAIANPATQNISCAQLSFIDIAPLTSGLNYNIRVYAQKQTNSGPISVAQLILKGRWLS
jgi:hypothetical protein